MSIELTYHGKRPFDDSDPADVLRGQREGAEGDQIAIAGGTKSEPLTYKGLYRIYAVTSSRVRSGPQSMINAAGGCRLDAGAVEVWWLEAGSIIACDEVN